MSDRGEEQFEWRETYFLWLRPEKRPSLTDVERAVMALPGRYELRHAAADRDGAIESLTILAPDDHAALEIEYEEGADILVEALNTAQELTVGSGRDKKRIAELGRCGARFEIMHFEQVDDDPAGGDGPDADEMLDPNALLDVMNKLVELTDGIAVDPQSGTLL
jgi:hypothetical protein